MSRALQKKDFSAAEAQVIAGKTVVTLQSIRNDESFKNFWVKVNSLASKNDINDPIFATKKKTSRSF